MSRTRHHYKKYRRALFDQDILPWWKLNDGPGVSQKKLWVRTIRNHHKVALQRAIQADWDGEFADFFLDHPRRLTHIWDWV